MLLLLLFFVQDQNFFPGLVIFPDDRKTTVRGVDDFVGAGIRLDLFALAPSSSCSWRRFFSDPLLGVDVGSSEAIDETTSRPDEELMDSFSAEKLLISLSCSPSSVAVDRSSDRKTDGMD